MGAGCGWEFHRKFVQKLSKNLYISLECMMYQTSFLYFVQTFYDFISLVINFFTTLISRWTCRYRDTILSCFCLWNIELNEVCTYRSILCDESSSKYYFSLNFRNLILSYASDCSSLLKVVLKLSCKMNYLK